MDRPELLGSAADSRGIRRHRQTADVKGRSITHSQWECLITPKYRLCIVIDAVQNIIADSLGQLRGTVPGFRILLIQIVLQGAVRLCPENFHHEFADIQANPLVVSGALIRYSMKFRTSCVAFNSSIASSNLGLMSDSCKIRLV